MRPTRRWLVSVFVAVTLAAMGVPAQADHATNDISKTMHALGHSVHLGAFSGVPAHERNNSSDIAFWEKLAIQGNYDGFRIVDVNGWLYTQPRPFGARDKAGPPPPRWVIRILLLLHPGLRARRKAASGALASRLWLQDGRRWLDGGRDAFVARLREFTADDPRRLVTFTKMERSSHCFLAHLTPPGEVVEVPFVAVHLQIGEAMIDNLDVAPIGLDELVVFADGHRAETEGAAGARLLTGKDAGGDTEAGTGGAHHLLVVAVDPDGDRRFPLSRTVQGPPQTSAAPALR